MYKASLKDQDNFKAKNTQGSKETARNTKESESYTNTWHLKKAK